ncbi:hypothetical protein Poli38472_004176 [Pythium oligandrum]|uniref:Kinesin motor domain-containing protein n=1 Tax=Pythium oligandrum TaxID=41045 RepID=A0A8K1CML2_PYTOL|nr:hypothetical protein Poli38472_004176 [Pythium oligandrum]|eukprot:TMW66411.1 hypothetical protein Poli38472_004176 [Pythium oligandrum]
MSLLRGADRAAEHLTMSENVQVAVRVRPFNDREKAMESTCCIRMVKETQQTIITDPETNSDKMFTFDYSYNSFAPVDDPDHASQDTVWDDIGIKVLEHAWNGFNVSLFAYGQTGAGKSFSMVGYGNDKGIIPRASEVIFERIDANTSEITFKVEASMMEIYNERVKDLFNPSSDNLKIRDHPRQGPYAEGLTRHAVSSYSEISRLMDAGILARTTASTNMNATSSRAHTIFQIVVTQSELNPSTNKVMEKVSRINLIDLAGSERAASTGATGTRLKEGAAINQSLSALGNCISALADIANGKKKTLVPYRNSKLTHLLKDSLGGNSKTIMIAALSPASVNYSETLSTLRYADRAKQIKNQAIVNEDPNQMLIRQLKEELEALRKAMMENTEPSRPQSRGSPDDGSDLSDSNQPRRELDPEKEHEITLIREQLEEHQRLLRESEKSWQDRLQETEELARKREEQLKALGLATNTEELKARSLKEPHLLNLNEDQLMSEKLLYFIQDGVNRIGRGDAEQEQSIVIGGLGIQKEHCVITRQSGETEINENEDPTQQTHQHDALRIRPLDGARIFINGVSLEGPEDASLCHCDRLILGNSNAFRVVIPTSRSEAETLEDVAKESHYDWHLAMKELNCNQMKANAEREALAEKEKQEMDAKVKKMEEMLEAEQQLAEEKLRKQRLEWEDYLQKLNEDMKQKELEIKTQMQSEGDQDKKRLAEQLAQQESKLAEELVKAEMSFERKQEELVQKQRQLEESLQKQMREAKLLSQQKERERTERLRFDDQLLHSIPLVNEANSIAEELQKHTSFAIKLIPIGPEPPALSHPQTSIEDDEIVIGQEISASLKVQVTFQEAGTYRSVMWDIDQFHATIYAMRELYQTFIENNRVLDPTICRESETDPFYEPPQHQLIGRSFVYLQSTFFGCKVMDATPIYDYRGLPCGTIKCEITPSILSHEWQAQQHRLVEVCPDDLRSLKLPTLDDFLGSNIRLNVYIELLRGIPGKLCKDTYVKLRWVDENVFTSPPATSCSIDPKIDFNVVIEKPVTPELITYIQSRPVEIEAYGIVPSSNLNKIASRVLEINSSSQDEESLGSSSVAFFDVDSSGKNTLNKKKSVRRRAGQMFDDSENDAPTLEKFKQQLTLQEKTLAENTQELEQKAWEVTKLQEQLESTSDERDRLRDALEEMARTNKLLQAKIEQQIMKESVVKILEERRKTIAKASEAPSHPLPVVQDTPDTSNRTNVEVNFQIKRALFDERTDQNAERPTLTTSEQIENQQLESDPLAGSIPTHQSDSIPGNHEREDRPQTMPPPSRPPVENEQQTMHRGNSTEAPRPQSAPTSTSAAAKKGKGGCDVM